MLYNQKHHSLYSHYKKWIRLQTRAPILPQINSHVNIDDKGIELFIIASIETVKRQNKKCGKDEVFALVKDSLEEAITWKALKNL